jgi:hypothetical protein
MEQQKRIKAVMFPRQRDFEYTFDKVIKVKSFRIIQERKTTQILMELAED